MFFRACDAFYASSLDEDCQRRLAALEKQEGLDREAEAKARARSSKYKDTGDFIWGVHPNRIERSKHGLQRGDEALR